MSTPTPRPFAELTAEEKAAVDLTVNIVRRHRLVASACAEARSRGHALVSLGCTHFRCVKCDESGFATMTYNMDFRKTCAGGLR